MRDGRIWGVIALVATTVAVSGFAVANAIVTIGACGPRTNGCVAGMPLEALWTSAFAVVALALAIAPAALWLARTVRRVGEHDASPAELAAARRRRNADVDY